MEVRRYEAFAVAQSEVPHRTANNCRQESHHMGQAGSVYDKDSYLLATELLRKVREGEEHGSLSLL
eukprot:766851-Hanusia_phi.AAC.3